MNIQPIRNEQDYRSALAEISVLMSSDPELGTPDGDRLDVMATLVEAYEKKHYQIDPPDPVEAIKFRIEQGAISKKDLELIIGRSNRVSEILNRKRRLSLRMIRKLHYGLGIPAEVLLGESSTMDKATLG
jgi:HTH-type transcriptional regulator / antitoxin HigA